MKITGSSFVRQSSFLSPPPSARMSVCIKRPGSPAQPAQPLPVFSIDVYTESNAATRRARKYYISVNADHHMTWVACADYDSRTRLFCVELNETESCRLNVLLHACGNVLYHNGNMDIRVRGVASKTIGDPRAEIQAFATYIDETCARVDFSTRRVLDAREMV